MAWVPGRGLLRALMLWLALALLASALPEARWSWPVAAGVVALLVLAAAVQLTRDPWLEVERSVAESLPLGEWTEVTLRLRTAGRLRTRFEIFDHHPADAESEGLPRSVVLRPGRGEAGSECFELRYRLRPTRRGTARFERVEIWRSSTFDLLRRRLRLGEPQAVRVLPNFRPVLSQGLVGIEERMVRLGFHLQRRRGEGLEFQELRDYREGDTLRQVDWKATARRGSLVARQYQEERNQQVVLLLDCGRRMHAREGDLTHFDHVLDASLLLAYVAHRQGDAVGMQAFAGAERWLPPLRGAGTVERVLSAIFDLQTTEQSPDYSAAVARLMERQSRRALVLLLTNLRDEDAEEMLPALQTLRQRHLVVVASIREMALAAMRDQPVSGHPAALEVTAAHHYLAARHRAHRRVRATGAFVLDVEPPMLPHALVARYLEIKRAGQL